MTGPIVPRRALGAVLPTLLSARSARAQPGAAQVQPDGARRLAQAANGIALQALAGLAPAPALLVSPLSLADACALLVPAATGPALETLRGGFAVPAGADPMAGFVALDAALPPGETLKRATALWLRPGVQTLPAYSAAIRRLGTLSLQEVDFASPQALPRINAWVAERTSGRIPTILSPPLNPRTSMAITAALHFKANWRLAFPAAATRPAPFRRMGAAPLDVPFLTATRFASYARDGALAALLLPYADDAFEFMAVAPAPEAPVDAVVAALRAGRLGAALDAFRFAQAEVVIALPRCQADATLELKSALRPTTLGPAFEREAEYQGMLGSPMQIDRAVQKCVLLMDEAGTEAAAATAITGLPRGVRITPVERPVFRADAPYLAAVRHKPSGIFVLTALIAEPQPVRA